jgi:hypothetical protein
MSLTRKQFLRAAAAFAALPASALLSNCGGGSAAMPATMPAPVAPSPASAPSPAPTKSAKRGVAYDLASAADVAALSPGVSWWYAWGLAPNVGAPADAASRYEMDFVPMVWGAEFDDAQVLAWLKAHPQVEQLLVMNEPNLVDGQADVTPQQAAALWPRFESITAQAGVRLVGPAVTWGTMPGYEDPVAWLDAFQAAYRAANGGRDPWIDALAFHWYDYGLAAQLDRLAKYGKPFWVTEMANWHDAADGAQVDTPAKQAQQMAEMVAVCESRADVLRYAWFTGRRNPDPHFSSLLAGDGELSPLGAAYLAQPFA